MGFQTKIGLVFGCICCFLTVKAQEAEQIDVELIYNKWVFSEQESFDDILVYLDEDDVIVADIDYDPNAILKFTRRNNKFYFRYSNPKGKPSRCGNDLRDRRRKAFWKKGLWLLDVEEEYTFLTLEHFVAEKGAAYVRTNVLEFQIVHLSEGRMVLKKLLEQAVH